MATFEHMFTASLDAVTRAVADLVASGTAARDLNDRALMASQTSLAVASRQLTTVASLLAGEVLARSTVNDGHSGLAQKTGFRTPQALIKHLTGSTAREASTLVRVGSILNDAAAAPSIDNGEFGAAPPNGDARPAHIREPWLVCLGDSIRSDVLSAAGAESIRNGLGQPTDQISVDMLSNAARELITRISARHEELTAAGMLGGAAPASDPEALFRWARDARDELDAEGVRDRERACREARSVQRWRRPDGMTQYKWLLPPEDAALVDGVYDQLTSPRRGGPRFTSEDDKTRAESILHDERTTEQLASDGFLELFRMGAEVTPTTVLGTRKPSVRVLVTETALRQRTGNGRIEGHNDAVSIETVERHVCESGTIEISFDSNNQPVDVGREQRLFTHRQRIALAARDGGCMAPGCDRPPSWTEAHHIKQWHRDHGRTDVDNGILLCRHHHLLFHDQGWEISRRDHEFWLTPPASVDHLRSAIPMPSKSAALRDLQRQAS